MNDPRWVYQANRSFGALNQGDQITFDDDGDPVMISLVGAGYLDLVSGPPVVGIPSEESVGAPTIKMDPPAKKAAKKAASPKADLQE